MRSLRQMPAGLPHGCRGKQRIPQAEERNRVHSLLRMHEGLSEKSTAVIFLKAECKNAEHEPYSTTEGYI